MRKAAQRGFTLIELVVVIAVLGILAGIAIPRFMSAREEAAKNTCIANRAELLRYYQLAVIKDSTLKLADFIKEPGSAYFAATPVCPSGGEFSVGVSGMSILCSFEQHQESVVGLVGLRDKSYSEFIKLLNKVLNGDKEITSGAQLNKLLAEENGGTSVEVTGELLKSIFGDTWNKTLYWHADYGGKNKNQIYFAGTSPDTHSAWGGYLVVVNGVLYKSTKIDTNGNLTTGGVAGLYDLDGEALKKKLAEQGFAAIGPIDI